MKSYGVLVIGCGHIGMQHLLDIYYRDDIRIEAVVDKNPAAAEAAARRCGAHNWGTDYLPYLNSDNIDIVIIATYAGTHLSILKDCLAHHKHVLCEKPIGETLEQGMEFVETVKAAKEKVLIGHILRHNASYQKMRELIQSGAIGELRLIRMAQNHHTLLDWERHRRLLEDCSPAVDCGVHYFDVVQWFTGSKIVEVTGFGARTQDDVTRDNCNLVTFRLENGCAGYYEVAWGQTIRTNNLKEFIGSKGRITLDMVISRNEDGEEGDKITVYHSNTGVYEIVNVHTIYKNMYGQLKALIDMIENDTPGNPTIDEVWRAFRVAQAAQESIETGKPVRIED